jgi:hypothetical protein
MFIARTRSRQQLVSTGTDFSFARARVLHPPNESDLLENHITASVVCLLIFSVQDFPH